MTLLSTRMRARRLHQLIAAHEYLLSDDCVSYHGYQARRNLKGKSFLDFLMESFDELGVPGELKKGDSPLKRNSTTDTTAITVQQGLESTKLENIKRSTWTTDQNYIDFRLDTTKAHRHCTFTELQHCGLIDDPANKQQARKAPRLSEESQESQQSQTSTSSGGESQKSYTRRWCVVCSKTVRDMAGRGKFLHVSRYVGFKAKRTSNSCSMCHVALCDSLPEGAPTVGRFANLSCFDRWHTCKQLPE